MCELFAMSASHPDSVNHSLALLRPRGGELGPHADGWWVAFYEGRAAQVFKEPVPAAESRCLAFIADYDFKSRMVIAHIRRANPEKVGRTSANTHPFEREWNGRSWVFAHNGVLPGIRENAEFAVRRFRPLGETDSEHAFCLLMDGIAASHGDARNGPSAHAAVDTIRPLAVRLARLGEFNFMLGNGDYLFVHVHTRLHELRRSCSTGGGMQEVVLLATAPLTDENWRPLAPDGIHVYAHGRGLRARAGDSAAGTEQADELTMREIYLDYNASTPIDPAVAAVMRPFLEEGYGNPSSGHWASARAKAALENARGQVAALLGAEADEIVFTSGGSEANNLALKGLFFQRRGRPSHIVTSQIEHPATLEPCRFLERLGAKVTYVPADATGLIDPDSIRRAITKDTFLISIMHANNETGSIQPIAEIAKIAREHGVPLHTDAAQSPGKIPAKVDGLGVDLLSIAGHKLYAPKGVGALYIRRGIEIEPLIHGAGHERGRRAGTESALLAAALGKACEIAQPWIGMPGVQRLRDLFWERLKAAFGHQAVLNGHPERRLPNTLNVSFTGRIGADILAQMPAVAASTGSACHSGQMTLSPVLKAMGIAPEAGMGAIRFSLGRHTTMEEVEEVLAQLHRVLA